MVTEDIDGFAEVGFTHQILMIINCGWIRHEHWAPQSRGCFYPKPWDDFANQRTSLAKKRPQIGTMSDFFLSELGQTRKPCAIFQAVARRAPQEESDGY